jgi:hypothetical protein
MNRLRCLMGLLLILACWPVFTFAANAPSLQVQWILFSGRPDPTVAISDPSSVRQFVAAFERLPPHPTLRDPNALGAPQLGYRGFRVTPIDMAGVTWIEIFGTAVAVASGGANGVPLSWSFRFDRDAALEQLLFQAVRAEGNSLTDYPPSPPTGVAPPGGGASNVQAPVATTNGAFVAERSVTINLGPPIVSLVPIPIRAPVTTPAGSRVKLIATAAEPTSEVTWVKDSRALPATGRVLEIAQASPADSGRYWAVIGLFNGGSTTTAQTELLITTREGPRLLNLSVLARIGAEQRVFTSGFTIETGPGSLRSLVLIRAVGPGLAPLGVGDTLGAPRLRVMDMKGAAIAAANQPFALPTVAAASERVGAFALPADSADVAQLYFLPAGGYTANVSAADTGTGVVLLEIFEVPLN